MYGHIVAYAHIVAYLYGRFLVKGVQNGAVLNVDAVSDAYGVHIAADHRVEPHAALVAHDHIAHQSGVVGKEAFPADLRREAAHRYYQRHSGKVLEVSHSRCASVESSGIRVERTRSW